MGLAFAERIYIYIYIYVVLPLIKADDTKNFVFSYKSQSGVLVEPCFLLRRCHVPGMVQEAETEPAAACYIAPSELQQIC